MKDTVKKMKRQARDWKKIFANHVTETEPGSRIFKELLQFGIRQPNFIMGKDLNRHFTKEEKHMPNKYIK